MTTTIFFSSPCHWTKTLHETSTYWPWRPSSPSLSWAEDTRVRCVLTISVSADVMLSSSASRTGSILRTIPPSLERLFYWRRNCAWKLSTRWPFKWDAQWSASRSSMCSRNEISWRATSQKSSTPKTKPSKDQSPWTRPSPTPMPPTWIVTTKISLFTCSKLNTKPTWISQWLMLKVTMMWRTPNLKTSRMREERWMTEYRCAAAQLYLKNERCSNNLFHSNG